MNKPTLTTNCDGTKHWRINGILHREDGPALEHSNGIKEWWFKGQRHRVDGPAIEYTDGSKEWWFNDKQLTEEEFNSMNYKLTDTRVSFSDKLKAIYKNSKLASNEEKKLVLEAAKEVLEDKASAGWESISFKELSNCVAFRLEDSIRTTAFKDAFNFATAILVAEGVATKDNLYFYWGESE